MPKSCIDCATSACALGEGSYPEFCPTLRMDAETSAAPYLDDPFALKVMREASATSSRAFCERLCRIEETMDFARRMGYRKIGIACCSALSNEARLCAKILRLHGFEVFGAACKVGAMPKARLEAQESCCDFGAVSCNPLAQARLLNEAGTHFNLVLGLCVGHDSLFYRHSEAPCTTMVVKDRALANNPAAAFQVARSASPYNRLLKEDESLSAADQ